MAHESGNAASPGVTMKKRSEMAPDIMRLLEILVQIERRRQARLRVFQKKDAG